jgi:hypothetical protein
MPGLLVDLFADLTPASAVCLSVSAFAAVSVPYYLTVDADLADFDPRPAVRRVVESGRLDPVWQVAVYAGHNLNRAIATSQRLASHALHGTSLKVAGLTALNARDRVHLAVVNGLLVIARRFNAPKGSA